MATTSPQSTGQFIAILILVGWAIPVVMVLWILIRKKLWWPIRIGMLLPTTTAVCAWLMVFCFMAGIFTGGRSYQRGMPLNPYQLYEKGRTFDVSPDSWRFQRWCDDHMAWFSRTAFWIGLLSALVAGVYRGIVRLWLWLRGEVNGLRN